LEGEVARLSPLLRIQVRAREGQGSNPTSSATRARARATLGCSSVEERVFGEHEAAGAIPVIPTNVRNPDSVSVMPSLRGSRHDSAKIDGGGSNPPGGTNAGRRGSVSDQTVETSDPERASTLRDSLLVCIFSGPKALGYPSTNPAPITCPVIHTSWSGDQNCLQSGSSWVQFPGGVPRPRFGAGRRVA
jgi:hypothetical protein